jgi:hypothetical protein
MPSCRTLLLLIFAVFAAAVLLLNPGLHDIADKSVSIRAVGLWREHLRRSRQDRALACPRRRLSRDFPSCQVQVLEPLVTSWRRRSCLAKQLGSRCQTQFGRDSRLPQPGPAFSVRAQMGMLGRAAYRIRLDRPPQRRLASTLTFALSPRRSNQLSSLTVLAGGEDAAEENSHGDAPGKFPVSLVFQ